jgi:hypothetical protein
MGTAPPNNQKRQIHHCLLLSFIYRFSDTSNDPVNITPIERKRSIEAVSIQLSALSLRSFD